MVESEVRDWVLVWVEDLYQQAGSKRFGEEEQERVDLGHVVYFCSAAFGKYGLRLDCHSGLRIDK